jgi:hypothetical protein
MKYTHSLKRLTIALIAALAGLSAWAQTDAERAQKAAQEAAAKAAEGRRQAAIEAAKAGLQPVFNKEYSKQAREQEKQREKARRQVSSRLKKSEMNDSIKLPENLMKLKTWRRGFFMGGQVGTNFAVADNITDHPPFKWGEAWGVGANVYAGTFFSRGFGVRGSLSYQNVRSRVDRETVNGHWHGYKLYNGNGFFHFDVLETNADILFDISGTSYSNHFYPFHAYLLMGTGLSVVGKKKLHGNWLVPDMRDEKGFILDPKGDPHPAFESRVDTKTHALWTFRLGLQFDYRISKHLSVNMEGTASISNDNFEGIKCDEPIDILLKGSAGLTFWF